MTHIPDSPERSAALAEHAAMAAERAARLAHWDDLIATLPASDRPEDDGARISRRRADRLAPATPGLSSARTRFLRGSDRLHNEQVDQYAATTTALMGAGLADPIGPAFSPAARQHVRRMRRYGAAFVREWTAGDVASAFHAIAYPDAYSTTTAAPTTDRPYSSSIIPRHQRIADRLSDVTLPGREPNGHGFTGADRDAWNLERQADAILRDAGEHVVRLDVRDARTHLMTVTPDRVAYRGTPVHTLPESAAEARAIGTRTHRIRVRHHKSGTRTAASWRLVTPADALPRARRAPLHATTVDLDAAWADAMLGRTVWCAVTELETVQLRGARSTWSIIGHRPAVRLEDRIERRTARRRAASAASGVKRGRPASHPLSLNERSLRRRWAAATPEQADRARIIVDILTTTTPDTTLTAGAVSITVIDGTTVRVNGAAVEPITTAARRLALIGAAVD